MPSIKCSVTECDYNKAVECHAPMIQVDRNNSSSASNSDQTKCETFKPKM
ncbi:DUF1540 domain-containing protein [Desulfoscipio geothermicus]|uniref:DUF1540 domain-containing protein n=1 Tax=Desulfoscipio geothermicus DSM 3669 TaxID=1121426 RepID=A0A1I6DQN8_9FIRM|nr:DUF1540 domain-containing protein [Desulfoscipio geothermicus]SFR07780.1 protein of unknown function [Desulfoscipio geothermicus DSM 3669]